MTNTCFEVYDCRYDCGPGTKSGALSQELLVRPVEMRETGKYEGYYITLAIYAEYL